MADVPFVPRRLHHFVADIDQNDPVDHTDQDPGDRVGDHQRTQGREVRKHQQYPGDPEHARTHDRGDGGLDGVSQPPQRAGDRIHDPAQERTAHHDHKPFHTPADHLRIRVVKTQQRSAEEQEERADAKGEQCVVKQTDQNTADDPFVLPAPQILSGKTHGALVVDTV